MFLSLEYMPVFTGPPELPE